VRPIFKAKNSKKNLRIFFSKLLEIQLCDANGERERKKKFGRQKKLGIFNLKVQFCFPKNSYFRKKSFLLHHRFE
jgi:hypothetical protein